MYYLNCCLLCIKQLYLLQGRDIPIVHRVIKVRLFFFGFTYSIDLSISVHSFPMNHILDFYFHEFGHNLVQILIECSCCFIHCHQFVNSLAFAFEPFWCLNMIIQICFSTSKRTIPPFLFNWIYECCMYWLYDSSYHDEKNLLLSLDALLAPLCGLPSLLVLIRNIKESPISYIIGLNNDFLLVS